MAMSLMSPPGVLPPAETDTVIEFRAPPPSPVASARASFDSRAPPPSPVASGRRSSFVNEDVLSEFLEHSLKVPDLILPDRVFPRQKTVQDIPKLDFEGLSSLESEAMMKFVDSVSRTGCFEVFNHGVPLELIKSALDAGNGIFGISPEKKKIVMRSSEKPYGFEDFHGDEEQEKDINDEFVWCKDETLKNEMEKILPLSYSNFSEKMEKLVSMMEKMEEKILQFLEQNTYSSVTSNWEDVKRDEHHQEFSSICCLQRHNNWQDMMNGDQSGSSLRYDVIRMLVRGSEFPHALCVHVCNGAQEFHVYSKKGWVSFHPDQDTLIITIGDHLKEWGRGQIKHVIGRPIFKGGDDHDQQHISMAFLYSPSFTTNSDRAKKKKKQQTISIGQQIVFVILFTLLYQFIHYICKISRG